MVNFYMLLLQIAVMIQTAVVQMYAGIQLTWVYFNLSLNDQMLGFVYICILFTSVWVRFVRIAPI